MLTQYPRIYLPRQSQAASEGEKVWEYVCPVTGDGPIKQGDPIPLDHRAHAMNAIFKVHRYDPDYPGLADKDLTPNYTLPLE